MPTFADARALAEMTLAEHLPDRWRHVQGVARTANQLVGLPGIDRDALLQSAVLHDIGYSPVVSRTGFHPLDGARFLATRGYDARVVALVAHHSAAALEAAERGIAGLEAYEDEAGPTRDALWFCDAVTGPTGDPVTPGERAEVIRRRHAPDDVVMRFLRRAAPELRAAVRRTEDLRDAAGVV